MPPTVAQTLKDPKFYGLPLDQQEKVLATLDKGYAALPSDQRQQVIKMAKQRIGKTPAGPSPVQPQTPSLISQLTEIRSPQSDTSVHALEDVFGNIGAAGMNAIRHPVNAVEGMFEPIRNALPSYAQTSFGPVPVPNFEGILKGFESAKQMAKHPYETIESAIGQAAVAGLAGEAAPYITKGVATPARIALQEAGGAGREPVAFAARSQAENFGRQQERYQQYIQDLTESNKNRTAAAKAEHAKIVQEAEEHNRVVQEQTAEANRKEAEEISNNNAQARAEWVRKEHAARTAEQKVEAMAGRKQVIERGQRAYAQRAIENSRKTYTNVKSMLDLRWNALRSKLGDTPIKSVPIQEAIEAAKEKYLMGAPESLKQFNDLIRVMQTDDMIDTPGGPKPNIRSLSWQEGRTHYTALGDKLYSGELAGNVKKAVGMVRDELDKELYEAAQNKGLGVEYRKTQNDWAEFKKDWDDMSNLSYSKTALGEAGSPLARLVRAADPAAAARVLSNERIVAQLARYQKQGASTALAKGFRILDDQLGTLEKITVPKHPARPVYKTFTASEPKVRSIPEYEAPSLRSPKRPPQAPSPVNPSDIRYRKLEEYASRPFRWYDFVTPTGIEHAILKSEALRRWIASQPRNEIITGGK